MLKWPSSAIPLWTLRPGESLNLKVPQTHCKTYGDRLSGMQHQCCGMTFPLNSKLLPPWIYLSPDLRTVSLTSNINCCLTLYQHCWTFVDTMVLQIGLCIIIVVVAIISIIYITVGLQTNPLSTTLWNYMLPIHYAQSTPSYSENIYDHITPILKDLHWLPVRKMIIFKIVNLTCHCVNGFAPLSVSQPHSQ